MLVRANHLVIFEVYGGRDDCRRSIDRIDEGQREKSWLAVGLSKTHGILV